jgi:hypothetical protein
MQSPLLKPPPPPPLQMGLHKKSPLPPRAALSLAAAGLARPAPGGAGPKPAGLQRGWPEAGGVTAGLAAGFGEVRLPPARGCSRAMCRGGCATGARARKMGFGACQWRGSQAGGRTPRGARAARGARASGAAAAGATGAGGRSPPPGGKGTVGGGRWQGAAGARAIRARHGLRLGGPRAAQPCNGAARRRLRWGGQRGLAGAKSAAPPTGAARRVARNAAPTGAGSGQGGRYGRGRGA